MFPDQAPGSSTMPSVGGLLAKQSSEVQERLAHIRELISILTGRLTPVLNWREDKLGSDSPSRSMLIAELDSIISQLDGLNKAIDL